MTLDAHIADFQNHVHYLTILDIPISKDDQLLQFIRSLTKHRDLATRVKFHMTMDEAIQTVQARAANNFVHDLVVPRNHPCYDGKQNGPSLNNLSLNTPSQKEDEELLNALEAGDFDHLLDENEDEDDTLNAIGSGGRGGGRGCGRGSRGGGRERGAGRGAARPTMTAQQLEWLKAQKCI
jgi:hypothetical protein